MARRQKLKVYRTPIGFHDAYVAAPNQKAALEAWGADVDLFARGVAETVTDDTLTGEPLAKPGTVIRRTRGTSEEHMAALAENKPKAKRRKPPSDEDDGPAPRRRRGSSGPPNGKETPKAKAPPSGSSSAKRQTRRPHDAERDPTPAPAPAKHRAAPRPSRSKLEAAERAIEKADADHSARVAEIRDKEKALQQERRDLERRYEAYMAKLERSLAKTRESYAAALKEWRD